jgi:hypothetical protein
MDAARGRAPARGRRDRRAADDPHSYPRPDPQARQQKSDFMQVDGFINPCTDNGPCHANGYPGPWGPVAVGEERPRSARAISSRPGAKRCWRGAAVGSGWGGERQLRQLEHQVTDLGSGDPLARGRSL